MDGARYIIAGGSGLLGSALGRLLAPGADLAVLTRSAATHHGPGRAVEWDGQHLDGWQHELDGAAAVINLAGRNLNTRWSAEARREILGSRLQSSALIGQAISRCHEPPAVWINASATGIYGSRGDEVLVEETAPAVPGSDFLADVCRQWESAVLQAQIPGSVRRVIVRFGVVLSRAGGALPILARLTKFFAGGRLGSGRQWMPWIHIDDATRAVQWAITSPRASGIYNVTSPNPVTNAELMRRLREALRRPPAPPAPAWAARFAGKVLGIPISATLASTRAVPRRMPAEGFAFRYPELAEALEDLLRRNIR